MIEFKYTHYEYQNMLLNELEDLSKERKRIIAEIYWQDAGVLDVIKLHINLGFIFQDIHHSNINENGQIQDSRTVRADRAATTHWLDSNVLDIIYDHQYYCDFYTSDVIQEAKKFARRRLDNFYDKKVRELNIMNLENCSKSALRVFAQQLKLMKY